MKWLILVVSLISASTWAIEKADAVLVKKSEHRLFLIKDGKAFKEFHVAFGGQPKGHKQQEGDGRTPEGTYTLDYKLATSSYYKAFHISYPNQMDVKRAKGRGVSPGGAIMIHGQKNGFSALATITQQFNWTKGCIALSNDDMDQLWAAIDAGTPIEITP
jgi:murein L,D-transpeptidase YafK